MRTSLLTLAVVVALAACCSSSWADATSAQQDLLDPASGVPNAIVSIDSPTADEALAGPGPILRVTMTVPNGQALGGILVPPGGVPMYTTTTAQEPRWDLAVIEAAKHQVLDDGVSLDSVAVTRHYTVAGSVVVTSGIQFGLPDYVPAPPPSGTLSTSEVRDAVVQALPSWARDSAVAVADDRRGEREITITLARPSLALRMADPVALLFAGLHQQQTLEDQGGNIARVLVNVTDASSGDPLYSAAGDSLYGFVAEWRSPLVAASIGSLTTPSLDVSDPTSVIPQ